ncbi:hypothetical protein RISK_005150 [Rhodopirellula islandica]|uniref:Uncharacterized protein n=1 Tax=Rhodopirellula islandica TaxID=595434 RepID=A0A0J1EB95_RHOIS|nr:hypothetical protein RISK_005150 [Rhodopirellula islandica]
MDHPSRSDESRQPWVSTQGHQRPNTITESRSDDIWDQLSPLRGSPFFRGLSPDLGLKPEADNCHRSAVGFTDATRKPFPSNSDQSRSDDIRDQLLPLRGFPYF